jgi:hypothetical protein
MNSRLAKPLYSLDVHQTSRRPQTEIRWHTIIILISAILLLGFLYFQYDNTSTNNDAPLQVHNAASADSPPSPLRQRRTPEPRPRDTEQNAIFSFYSLQQAN